MSSFGDVKIALLGALMKNIFVFVISSLIKQIYIFVLAYVLFSSCWHTPNYLRESSTLNAFAFDGELSFTE